LKRIGFNGLRTIGTAAFLCVFLTTGRVYGQQSNSSRTELDTRTQSASTPTGNAKTDGISSLEVSSSPQAHSTVQHPTLEQLTWLEGQWRGEWGSRTAEQTWLELKAGEIAGLFRVIEGEKTLVLELFSFVEKPDGVQFYLRHLTPELLPWEKSDATMLKLESIDATKATFVNAVNGEPKRIIFTRLDADTYTERSEIEPETGEPQVIEITFHRQKPQAAAPASAGSGVHRKKP
jgi:hypothetical protein